jgi:hypothetical protein
VHIDEKTVKIDLFAKYNVTGEIKKAKRGIKNDDVKTGGNSSSGSGSSTPQN